MEYKDKGKFNVCEWRSDIYTETGSDYVLPDYNGDVRKILYTEAKVKPSGSFEDGENVNFSGIIVYNMVYSDSENKINSISFTSDYDANVKCKHERCDSSFADVGVSDYTMRLLGPRKISAKATVSLKAVMDGAEGCYPTGSAFESGNPEIKTLTVSSAKAHVSEEIEREYAEEILRLDGRVADEVEIVYSDAEAIIDSVSTDESGAMLRGNLRIKTVIKTESEPIQTAEKMLRIEESISFAEANGAMRVLPRVSVNSVRCTVTADESGCSVVANVIAGLAVEVYDNENVTLVTDAYRCDCNTENQYAEYTYYELATALTEKDELSMSVERRAIDIDNLREVICLGSNIKITDTNIDSGMCCILGEVNYSGLASGTDENGILSYHPFKYTGEFSKNVNINCQNDKKTKLIPDFCCTDAVVTVDESNLYLSCKCQMKLIVLYEECEKILNSSEIVLGEAFEPNGEKITVYYPEDGESVFEIAKKFHTTVERISSNNSSVRASGDFEGSEKPKRLIIF